MKNSTTSAAKKKPNRIVRLVHHPEMNVPGRVLLFEHVGKRKPRVEIDDYLIREIPADWGMAWKLEKTATTRKGANVGEVYNVLIDGTLASCDCRGHEAWSKCKHVSAIRQLLDHGKLISLIRLQEKQDRETLELLETEWCQGHDF